jgi:hypothetical protein
MQYSWLFAQLNALDASAGVIAIGGGVQPRYVQNRTRCKELLKCLL